MTAFADELQPRQLIVTIYGLYARAEHDWLSVASLVRLMGEVGVEEPAVRSSVSRLKRRDTLRSLRVGSSAGYALSPSSLQMLRDGDERIFNRPVARLADGWVLLAFSVPETMRDKRHELRSTLSRLGFGTVAPGVWVAPGSLARETRDTLARRELDRYVEIFRGDHIAFGEVREKVRQWWDLDGLASCYGAFLTRYRPLARRWAGRPSSDRTAFRDYVPMLTAWRRLPYLDPGLPLELLPSRWPGQTARELFTELNRMLSEPSRRFAHGVIHGGSTVEPPSGDRRGGSTGHAGVGSSAVPCSSTRASTSQRRATPIAAIAG
jgi:phenylacetic acid degradation operon negative regulatory protein